MVSGRDGTPIVVGLLLLGGRKKVPVFPSGSSVCGEGRGFGLGRPTWHRVDLNKFSLIG